MVLHPWYFEEGAQEPQERVDIFQNVEAEVQFPEESFEEGEEGGAETGHGIGVLLHALHVARHVVEEVAQAFCGQLLAVVQILNKMKSDKVGKCGDTYVRDEICVKNTYVPK